LKVVVI